MVGRFGVHGWRRGAWDIVLFSLALIACLTLWIGLSHRENVTEKILRVARLNNDAICQQSLFLINNSLSKTKSADERQVILTQSRGYLAPVNSARRQLGLPPCPLPSR